MTEAGVLAQFDALDNPAVRDAPVKWLGVRGYRRLDPGAEGMPDPGEPGNELGIYDDMVFVVVEGKLEGRFVASTDPGRYYVQHPTKPTGCAQLRPGLWWYQPGIHLGKALAFRQAEPVIVNRLGPTGRINLTDKGWFGIHVHSGGSQYSVGNWSAGCQVVQCPEGAWGKTWQDFRDLTLHAIGESVGGTTGRLLADAIALKAALEEMRSAQVDDDPARGLFTRAQAQTARIPYLLVDRLLALPA